jgi:acetyltransferase-like isoleucine patch superfamily enzyme
MINPNLKYYQIPSKSQFSDTKKKKAMFKHPTAIVESEEIGEGTKIWHFVHVREKSKIGKNCTIGKGVYIDTEVEIGDNVKIENFVSVYKGVKIEDGVLIGPAVTFTNDLYPRTFIWGEDRLCHTTVRRGASVGANATVICGITIGEYAMVGAGSVVTKDVPPYGLVYGNPARLEGFACSCGRKLEKIVEERDDMIVYECECGKEVETARLNFSFKKKALLKKSK